MYSKQGKLVKLVDMIESPPKPVQNTLNHV